MTELAVPSFDRLAGVYRWMEWLSFGSWLWRCRCAFLGEMRTAQRALVLGDGDGRFTTRLLEDNPAVRVDAVDMSSAMLAGLMERAGEHRERVRLVVADLRAGLPVELPVGDGYDLVATHFLLDCLTTAEVESLAAEVRARVAADAVWVVSEFAIPDGWFGMLVARPVVGFLYRAFGLVTGLKVRNLPEWRQALKRAGFESKQKKDWLNGLLISEILEARD